MEPYAIFLKRRDQSGFTLLELVCVLALLGILALIALPRLQPVLQDLELRREAQEMAAVLRQCRSQAVLDNQAVEVRFYPYAKPPSYEVSGPEGRESYTLEEGIRYDGISFSHGSLGSPTCVFFANGSSYGGTITLNQEGNLLYVIVYPQTARVRVSTTPPT